MFWIWLIVWFFTLFCFLPTYSIKIARQYGRWFGTGVYATIWQKLFWIGAIVTVILSVLEFMM